MATFNEIYNEAKEYYIDQTHQPINAEVRYFGHSVWRIESGLIDASDVLYSCNLESFNDFFYETWDNKSDYDFDPEIDENIFLEAIEEWNHE